MDKIKRIAPVAHDNRKKRMVEWVEYNWNTLMRHTLVCTGTTGRLVEDTIRGKAQLSALVDRAARGEEIIISKAGKAVAVLVAYSKASTTRVPGRLRGKIKIAQDFDSLPSDTALWWLADDPALPDSLRSHIADNANLVAVSAVTVREVAIKASLGRIVVDEHWLSALVRRLSPVHRDPFDRMLIAQALEERFTLVTVDRTIPKYPVDRLAV